jgi:hypothetical protein
MATNDVNEAVVRFAIVARMYQKDTGHVRPGAPGADAEDQWNPARFEAWLAGLGPERWLDELMGAYYVVEVLRRIAEMWRDGVEKLVGACGGQYDDLMASLGATKGATDGD